MREWEVREGTEFRYTPFDALATRVRARPRMDSAALMSAIERHDTTADETRSRSLQDEMERAAEAYDQTDLRVRILEVELQAARGQREVAANRLEHLGELARSQGLTPVLRVAPEVARNVRLRQGPRSENELSGARLREAAIQSVLERGEVNRPIHHTQWLAWLRADGFEPAGKRPENVFLTQIGRSPLVRRGEEPGFYVVEPNLVGELQDQLRELHEQFATLPPPDQMSLIGDGRQRRQELQTDINRTERMLQEAWRLLSAASPQGAVSDWQEINESADVGTRAE